MNQTVTRWLGVFISDQNGGSAFTGNDSVVMTYNVYNDNGMILKHTYTFTLNNPNVSTVSIQNASRAE